MDGPAGAIIGASICVCLWVLLYQLGKIADALTIIAARGGV